MKKNNLLKLLWKGVKGVIFLILFLVFLIIIVQRVFNNNVSVGGYRIFTVASGSMEPKYKVLDMLLVKETVPKDIKLKDDIVYMGKEGTYAGKVITHQVIQIEEGTPRKFLTQGIANTAEDPLVYEDQLFGKVVYKLLFLSLINRVISSNVGFFFIIVVPIGILIFLEILDIKKTKEELNASSQ